jgi:8-oxo-dGTP pyrophosphatase MutT (NUDIX family)
MRKTLTLAVGVLRDDQGRMLVVRKKSTTAFMQPGGKIDAGETPKQALKRELFEELSIEVDVQGLEWLGKATSPAANEPETDVVADIFAVKQADWPEFTLTAEIEEARWLDQQSDLPLAPLTQDEILPLLKWS